MENEKINEIGSDELEYMLTTFSINFNQDYRKDLKLKEKTAMLFRLCKNKGFTPEGLRKAVVKFVECQRYQQWTAGDFFALFPNKEALKPYIDPAAVATKPKPAYKIISVEDAKKMIDAEFAKEPGSDNLEDIDQAEADAILENIRLRCLNSKLQTEYEHIKRMVPSVFTSEAMHALSPEEIMNKTANYFNITANELKSQCRNQNYAWPRHIAIYLMKIAGYTLKTAGEAAGGRDHSTALHSVTTVKDFMKWDTVKRNQVKDVANIVFGDIVSKKVVG